MGELPAKKFNQVFFFFLSNASLRGKVGFFCLFCFVLSGFLELGCREDLAAEAEAIFYHLG